MWGSQSNIPGPSTWGTGQESSEALVAKVKELRRLDPNVQTQWSAYTDINGGGTRDPGKHSVTFLQGFLDHVQTGHQILPGALPGAAENPSIAEMYKMMQKKSSSFKGAWEKYCVQMGGGRYDPTKHDTDFNMQFLDYLAGFVLGGGTVGASDENPLKRLKGSVGTAMGTNGSGDPVKDELVAMVKNYQRLGPEYKEVWSQYSDTYLGGVKDPSRHDTATLHEFCTNHEVPQVEAMDSASAMDDEKTELVQRIKTFQKSGEEHKEAWLSVCGSTKDPARHPKAKLQEFCQLLSI